MSSALNAFRLEFIVRLGADLRLELACSNRGDESFHWTGALHPFLPVADVRRISMSGLEGCPLLDYGVDNGPRPRRLEGALRFPADVNGIYTAADADCRLDDGGGRSFHLSCRGTRSVVVWNAGSAEKAARVPGLCGDDWASFFCVEPAVAGDQIIEQAPGSTYRMGMTLAAERR
jgi:glucose-6-phosphate 1-epimerase